MSADLSVRGTMPLMRAADAHRLGALDCPRPDAWPPRHPRGGCRDVQPTVRRSCAAHASPMHMHSSCRACRASCAACGALHASHATRDLMHAVRCTRCDAAASSHALARAQVHAARTAATWAGQLHLFGCCRCDHVSHDVQLGSNFCAGQPYLGRQIFTADCGMGHCDRVLGGHDGPRPSMPPLHIHISPFRSTGALRHLRRRW